MLAHLQNKFHDELVCDFAEYYHIYDYRRLPARYAATLACGLRPDSRCYMAAYEVNINTQETLLAEICDILQKIAYQQVIISGGKQSKPESLLEKFLRKKPENKDEYVSLTFSEFDQMREQILRS